MKGPPIGICSACDSVVFNENDIGKHCYRQENCPGYPDSVYVEEPAEVWQPCGCLYAKQHYSTTIVLQEVVSRSTGKGMCFDCGGSRWIHKDSPYWKETKSEQINEGPSKMSGIQFKAEKS